jgi:hypothetical protein
MIEFTLGLTIGIIITAVFYNHKYNKVNNTLTDKILINSILKNELKKMPSVKTKTSDTKTKKTRRGNTSNKK